MPEGDTVWRTAHRLDEALAGEYLVRCDLRVPRWATADLTGRRVQRVIARGKHLLARIDGGLTLHSHLGMDGAWRVYPATARWRGGAGHQIRAVLGNRRHTAVGYRLAVLELVRTDTEATAVGPLGPDPLGPDWDPEEAARGLLRDPTSPLGAALLDQRKMAGVGNVYKSELCFLLRASPWLPVGAVEDVGRLTELAARLLRVNAARTARVTTGDPRADQRLWVYGRAGRPCRRCGRTIRVAGERHGERLTYWCPRCQPTPSA